MALVVNDRVKETSSTTGTGALTFAGAVSGFETFSAGIGNSNTTYYAVVNTATPTEWEVGLGTLAADSSTITRTTVISSSNSDSAVSFGAGTKEIFCTLPASKAVIEDASSDVTLPDDLILGSDSSVLKFGADSDTTFTHTDGTGLTLNSTNKICFNDTSQFVQGSSATVLSLGATDEIDLTATAVDINGTCDISGTFSLAGTDITTTAAEINLIDGGTARGTTAVASGDGLLVNDGGTMAMTNVDTVSTYFSSHSVGGSNIVTTGALDSGSITSGFGAIDNGTSGIRTATFTAETAFVPDTDDGAALGTTSLNFADAYFADGAVINLGDDQDVTLTHVADTGILLNSTRQLQFNDSSQYINAPSATVLDINATDEIELNATAIDLNGTLDVSGTLTQTGVATFTAKPIMNAGLAIKNGATGPGFIELYEDSDNGSNKITLTGAASTGDVTIAFDGMAGTVVVSNTEDGNDVQLDSLGLNTAASGTAGELRAGNDITAFYSSDVSLKENITQIPSPMEMVKKINGYFFDWKDSFIKSKGGEDGYFVRKKDVGVLAQDIEKVLPEVVATRKDGIKAVKYDRLVSLLIECVKDLQGQVDKIKGK